MLKLLLHIMTKYLTWQYINSNMFIGATKSGRRLALLSEGLIPSVYIDNPLWKKYWSKGGDCSYVFRSDYSICDNAYSSRRFVLYNRQTKITAQAPIWCGYNLYYILIQFGLTACFTVAPLFISLADTINYTHLSTFVNTLICENPDVLSLDTITISCIFHLFNIILFLVCTNLRARFSF